MTQAPGTSYNLEFLSPTFKTLSQQPAIRTDYQLSSALRFTAKYTGQRGFRGTTPGTIPDFNDTFGAYPWVHAFATTVNYTANATTFIEATYGYSNRRLGGIVNSALTYRNNSGLAGLPSLFPDAYVLPEGSYNRRVMEDVAPPFFVNGRAELAPTFQWGTRIGTPPPNLAYPAFLNTNPTQDFSTSLTRLAGRHTMKVGFYSNHSLKQQNLNQRNALPFQGDLSGRRWRWRRGSAPPTTSPGGSRWCCAAESACSSTGRTATRSITSRRTRRRRPTRPSATVCCRTWDRAAAWRARGCRR